MGGTDGVGLELLPMVTADHPLSGSFDVLARNRECEMPDHRSDLPATLDGNLEDSEAVVGVVERHPFRWSRQGFPSHDPCGNYTANRPASTSTTDRAWESHPYGLRFRRRSTWKARKPLTRMQCRGRKAQLISMF